jgi:hypothetical protein
MSVEKYKIIILFNYIWLLGLLNVKSAAIFCMGEYYRQQVKLMACLKPQGV